MKKSVLLLAVVLLTISNVSFSQIATTTDNDKKVDVQLVSLTGNKLTGEIRPVLKFRGHGDWDKIGIRQPIAWNANGEILRAPENDVEMWADTRLTDGIWLKFNPGNWFRLVDPTKSVPSLSVLRISFSIPGLEYSYGVHYFDFIDVPVEWEMPEAAPTTVAARLGVKPFTGRSYYLWEDKESPDYYKSRYLYGDVRLECVSRDSKTGIARFTLQLKVDNPKEEQAQAMVYVGEIKYIDDKGSYISESINQFYPVRKGEWTEVEIDPSMPFFFKQATTCKWLQITLKNDQDGRDHFFTAYDVPINTVVSDTQNKSSQAKNGTTTKNKGKK